VFFFFQAESREKERLKEETRKSKKLEAAFLDMLEREGVDGTITWDVLRPKLEHLSEFQAIALESERCRLFNVSCVFYSSASTMNINSPFSLSRFFFSVVQFTFGWSSVEYFSIA
jgi:hypothetical protein